MPKNKQNRPESKRNSPDSKRNREHNRRQSDSRKKLLTKKELQQEDVDVVVATNTTTVLEKLVTAMGQLEQLHK